MNCILCLKIFKTKKKYIEIFAAKSLKENVVQIIKKHFWLEPHPEKHKIICKQCWGELKDFHEFYTRVEECHRLLEETAATGLVLEAGTETTTKKNENVITLKRRGTQTKAESIETDKQEKTERRCSLRIKKQDELFETQDTDVVTDMVDADSITASDDALALVIDEDPLPVQVKLEPALDENCDVDIMKMIYNMVDDQKTDAIDIKAMQEINIKDEPMSSNNISLDDACDSSNDQNEFLTIHTASPNCMKIHKQSKKEITKRNDEFLKKNYILSCFMCLETLETFALLKQHFRAKHNMRGYVLCCNKKLGKRGVLVDHIRFHQDPNYFKCKRCEKVLCDRRSLEKHEENHDDKKERIYKCPTCSKSYYRRVIFERHLLVHVPEEQRTVKCPKCEKTFATKYVMNQHLKIVHLDVYSKICDVCGKKVRGGAAMERHMQIHAGIEHTPIQCELCGTTLTNKYGLARHIKVRHTEENLQPMTCTICGKVSPNWISHERHKKYMHRMQRKHACHLCEKAFRRATELKEHMTTHTGEVLYTCPHCPKTFNSNANMYAHRKKTHRKEWEETQQSRYRKDKTTIQSQSILAAALATTNNTQPLNVIKASEAPLNEET